MPLPKPALDNRRFDQLVSESRALLARHAPQWTDHNASDPGITLLELGAWLGEQTIYRFDRLSQEARRAFVRLLGIEPRPAGVARSVVALQADTALALPARMQLAGAVGALFETLDPVQVSPARLLRVAAEGRRLSEESGRNAARSAFAPFGSRPRPGHALLLGFDRALDAHDTELALHVWTRGWAQDESVRAALAAEAPAGSSSWHAHYRVRTVWEVQTGTGWRALDAVVDETRALSLSGFVHFAAPQGHTPAADGLFYLRCRIVSGRFECPPELVHIAFNAVQCEHALTRDTRNIGISRGHAAARFAIGESPVVAGSVTLNLEHASGDRQADWTEVPDWDRIGAHARAFVLDAERGEIESGDGLRGQRLPAGYAVCVSYRSGGGSTGNLSAGTLTALPLDAVNIARAPALATLATAPAVSQPFPAQGGSARESLATAQARAYERANEADKAVTLEDFERLALATPGVPIGRVAAVAGLDPLLPCYSAAGTVTVVAIPACPAPAPMPSRAMLDAIAHHLAPRRLVTSALHVIAPRYRRVAVQASLHLSCNADALAVERAAHAGLDTFLDPLRGGPDGSGWPFGRAVYRSEILALLAQVPGVARVTALGLIAGSGQPLCDRIDLCAHELVRAGRHRLRIETGIPRILQRSEPNECESA